MGGHVYHRYVGPRWERAPSRGPDLIRDTSEKVSLIRQRLLTAQSRQKSYADVRRRPLGGCIQYLLLMTFIDFF